MQHIPTPYYLIDKAALLKNLQIIDYIRKRSGAKMLLALKCFATWSVFDLMREYMDGTTSSSLHEVKLGYQKFGGETQAYSVAFADHEIEEVIANCDKIIFNSVSQLERYVSYTRGKPVGLRLNPGFSSSSFDLADPARLHSRLGEGDAQRIASVLEKIDGVMIHNNCENKSFERFDEMLTSTEERYGEILHNVKWVSLGGGISYTSPDYPVDAFCDRIRQFSEKYNIQVYLEPGEASVRDSTTLEVSVLDIGYNGKHLAIVDSSTEAHMLDLLIYRETAPVGDGKGEFHYQICGKTCLAGDIFGEASFEQALQIGSRLSIGEAAAYTMVKKNWFNGVPMPSIVVKETDGSVNVVRQFGYDDYVSSLS